MEINQNIRRDNDVLQIRQEKEPHLNPSSAMVAGSPADSP
jgi:hypothetical protein